MTNFHYYFSVAKAITIANVCLSVTKTHQPLRIMPIRQICPSAIMLPWPTPLTASQNHNYWPSILSAIMHIRPSDLCPAFTTFKPFWLVLQQYGSLMFSMKTYTNFTPNDIVGICFTRQFWSTPYLPNFFEVLTKRIQGERQITPFQTLTSFIQ